MKEGPPATAGGSDPLRQSRDPSSTTRCALSLLCVNLCSAFRWHNCPLALEVQCTFVCPVSPVCWLRPFYCSPCYLRSPRKPCRPAIDPCSVLTARRRQR